MLRLGIIFTVTGLLAIVYGLLAGGGHIPERLTRHHPPPRASWIIGLVLFVVGVPFLVVALI